jgi:hypothetical protein
VLLSTLTRRSCVALVDISETGARLGAEDLPEQGEVVEVTVDGLRTYGTVAWSSDEECGIAFDQRLTLNEVTRLRKRAGFGTGRSLTVDQRVALEQWLNGVSR